MTDGEAIAAEGLSPSQFARLEGAFKSVIAHNIPFHDYADAEDTARVQVWRNGEWMDIEPQGVNIMLLDHGVWHRAY